MFVATIQIAQATDYTKVGVSVGNTADYSITGSAIGPSGTAKLHVEVTAVSGTNVSLTVTCYFSNGSIIGIPIPHTGDISSVWGGMASYIVCAGLTTGDELCKDSRGETFNSSTSATVCGANRTVNYITGSSSVENLSIGFDKDTGVLVENTLSGSLVNSSMIMTATNMWGSSGISLTTLAIVGVVSAAIVVAAVVEIVQKRKQ
jgi:hypothetical protein